MKKFALFLLPFLLLSCASEAPAPPVPPPFPAAPVQKAAKESWQGNWENTLAQAKKEGKVVLRSELPQEINRALADTFQAKTGIHAEIEPGARGGVMYQKIFAERRSGIYLVDLVIGSGITLFTVAKPAEVLEPFEKYLFLPDVIDLKVWYDARLPWFDKDRTIAYLTLAPSTPLTVNTNFLKPEEIKSYRDLLKPDYKQKILFLDPTMPGQGNQWFGVYAREDLLGLEFMKTFAKQEPTLFRDIRVQSEWLSLGKSPISLGVGWAIFAPFLDAGAPVASVQVKEPDYLTGAAGYLAMIKNAPHQAAAKLFLNWILSKEGAMVVQKNYERQSPRLDTGIEGLNRTKALRVEGQKYYNAASEDYEKEKAAIYEPKIKEIFGPLLR